MFFVARRHSIDPPRGLRGMYGMTLGHAPDQGKIFNSSRAFCDEKLSPTSVYRYLHDNCHRLFPDESFADLFKDVGRRSIPPRIVSVVMALQRIEGLSDREAVDRFTFDVRWKYAAGGLDLEYPGFVHTVLVDMRARLRSSSRPTRIFDVVLEAAKAAGVVGRKRVLDSTPLYDAVATQDTVTMIRSAIRGLLREAPNPLESELRGLLQRDDDYSTAGKPNCDWDDTEARDALVDALSRDAFALLAYVDGEKLDDDLAQAATLLAAVVGQDIEEGEDGTFRIARRVAKDRVISTVDPEARHGHKTSARGFDGYKGHISIDPDSEIITAAMVTPGNTGDGAVAVDLLAETLGATETEAEAASKTTDETESKAEAASETTGEPETETETETTGDTETTGETATETTGETETETEFTGATAIEPEAETATAAEIGPDAGLERDPEASPLVVFGDAAYGIADNLKELDRPNVISNLKVQGPAARKGKMSKDAFDIDLDEKKVTCPAGTCAEIRFGKDGYGTAGFGASCSDCALRPLCTEAKAGRTIKIHADERLLSAERERQKDPGWLEEYRATRPKVERKIGHLMTRRHGGRRGRMRGLQRMGHDFSLLAAVANLKRLAMLAVAIPAMAANPA